MGFALSQMEVRSDSFATGGAIPQRHTQEGDDVSPALSWSGAPEDAKAFAVICHDPDAPLVNPGSYGFVHWVLYNNAIARAPRPVVCPCRRVSP